MSMSSQLSPHVEDLIAHAVANGMFPTREAVLEAGVERLFKEVIPPVPDEHLAAVELGLAEIEQGLVEDMTKGDWDELHQLVQDVAAGKNIPAE